MAVIGAGAVGCVVAAAALEAGHDVTLCARVPLEAIRVDRSDGTRILPVRGVVEPGAVSPVDWILLATKAQDTAGAGPWLARLAGPATPVVVLQNGLDHVGRLHAIGFRGNTVYLDA